MIIVILLLIQKTTKKLRQAKGRILFQLLIIKNQMLQYGQAIPDEKEVDGIVARVMSNKDEIKRLTEQLTSTRILNFFKDNFNYKTKKVSYDEYIKEAYPS